jgi:hypothetical protein
MLTNCIYVSYDFKESLFKAIDFLIGSGLSCGAVFPLR